MCIFIDIPASACVAYVKIFSSSFKCMFTGMSGSKPLFIVALRLQSHAKFGSRRVGLTVNACDLITMLLNNVHLGVHSDNWDSENIVKNAAYKKVYGETCDNDMILSVTVYDGSSRICTVSENVLYCVYMYYVVYLTWYSLANVTKLRWRV